MSHRINRLFPCDLLLTINPQVCVREKIMTFDKFTVSMDTL